MHKGFVEISVFFDYVNLKINPSTVSYIHSGLFLFSVSCTGTTCTNGCRSCETTSVREATILLHGDDPVCHQQPQEQEDDTERDLHVDRGPLPLLQTGGQTRMEGTLELKNKRIMYSMCAHNITYN